MKRTVIEYNHDTGVFTIQEIVEGEKCHYQTKDIWQVIQRVQNLVCEIKNQGYWWRE